MVIKIDDDDLKAAMRHLARQFNGPGVSKTLKRKTSAKLRKIIEPMVAKRRAAVRALPSRGGVRQGGSMRQAVAQKTRAGTRWSGKDVGVQIIQRARGMPRDFRYAGRMFNREIGWDPVSLDGSQRHQQMRPAGWFDEPMKEDRRIARRQVIEALEETAAILAKDIGRAR